MTRKTSNHMTWKLRATVALVLALALSTFPAVFSRAVNAQTPAKATSQTPAKTTSSPAGESKGGQKEGIKVHGHWTIDVRNPNGMLVTHREFENSLHPQNMLSLFLSRSLTPGLWRIGLLSFPSVVFLNSIGEIVEPNDPLTDPIGPTATVARTCTVVYDQSNNGLVLSGNITAVGTGFINQVFTENFSCPGNVAPASCTSSFASDRRLTSTVFANVNVVAGQIIQVTVVITFS